MKTNRFLQLVIAIALILGHSALAHPVAQGALDIQIDPQKIHVRARVTGEEVFVANTFAAQDESAAGSLPEVWQRHGRYLLAHLKIFADGQALTGTISSVAASQNDFVVYELEFATPPLPAHLRVEENVLNEIEYGPGNPWEASYVVTIRQQARLMNEGLLLSRTQPLVFDCDWNHAVPTAVAPPLDQARMTRQYILHGIGHILSGYDHLLFILALVLATKTFVDLIKVVTAFTVAHTVTLTLSVLNIVRLPSHIVEPMIAGSIVFVAVTNVFWPGHSRGWLRLATAFFFGLFHGLGFAGGLLEAMNGLNGVTIGIAIAAFSLGVELGHQLVVLPVFAGLKLAGTTRAGPTERELLSRIVMRGGSVLISVAGVIYLVAALR